ncbi:MAG: fumarate reductase/succinate dehydrogenase flavoprotein subunit, partial [Myxococcota bacterium]|nr:fumarate reductase/succinate dehydrogenase flavoprotein subunit [Myxococcota bacterium]
AQDLNKELERAWRVADYLEFAELFVEDALSRDESCGGHFREEHQTEEGEAKRNDADFAYVGAWQVGEKDAEFTLHKEPLHFEDVEIKQRSYK